LEDYRHVYKFNLISNIRNYIKVKVHIVVINVNKNFLPDQSMWCGSAKGPDKKASRNAARQASGLFAEVMICRNAR
jgi:hypothetical protein